MTGNCTPIGFFDSGVGGISVLKAAAQALPNENFIYYGDSANAPYGEKSEDEIQRLSLRAGAFLFSKGVKAIVMACNTATSAAVKKLRELYNIPVISMEPAVKPALEQTEGKVLVLATPATVSQPRYQSLLGRLGQAGRVINVGCAGLVELIERGQTDIDTVSAYLDEKLDFAKDEDVRAAVLGCTHYPFVRDGIKKHLDRVYQTDTRIFDGSDGTVRQLKRVLDEAGMMCESAAKGRITFYTSGNDHLIAGYRRLFESF